MKNNEMTKKATKTIVIIYFVYILYLVIMCACVYGVNVGKLLKKIKDKIICLFYKLFSKNKHQTSKSEEELCFTNDIELCEETILG